MLWLAKKPKKSTFVAKTDDKTSGDSTKTEDGDKIHDGYELAPDGTLVKKKKCKKKKKKKKDSGSDTPEDQGTSGTAATASTMSPQPLYCHQD